MSRKLTPSLLSDLLEALEVDHTVAYSNRRFEEMPFRSLFGLSKLLKEYGIDNKTLRLSDKSAVKSLTPPFIAGAGGRFVVVTDVGPDRVSYLDGGESRSIERKAFDQLFCGVVMLAYPGNDAREPSYTEHHYVDIASAAKGYVMAAAIIIVVAWFFITRRVYDNAGAILLCLFNIAGLYVSYLLVRKTLGFKDKAAERVCSVMKAGGCDSIMETSASKFFGLFAWSEVGLAYFSVSLITLLVFPSQWTNLALINACTLPYSFWSIWYQRHRAHTWCTLCVCVQCLLWIEFACYWIGGMWQHGHLLDGWQSLIILGLTYLSVMLILNAIDNLTVTKPRQKS